MKILFVCWLLIHAFLQMFLTWGIWLLSPWLLPIKWLPAVFSSPLLWKPAYKIDWLLFPATKDSPIEKLKKYKAKISEQIMNTFYEQDGAKSIGLLSIANKTAAQKLFYYFFSGEFQRRKNPLAFSNDMFAGLLPGLWFNEISNNDKYNLNIAIDNLIYKWPFFKTNGTGGRGYMFRSWFTGDKWLACLTALATFSKLFPNRKDYKFLYYFTLVISFPFAFINAETSIFIGRFMGTMFYNTHSRAWNCYLAYCITGNRGYRWALGRIAKKYSYNPEITALYLLTMKKEYIKQGKWIVDSVGISRMKYMSKEIFTKIRNIQTWLSNYDDTYLRVAQPWMEKDRKYFPIKPMTYFNADNFFRSLALKIQGKDDKWGIRWTTRYHSHILPSEYRNTMWDNAKKPMKNENHGKYAANFDFIVVEYLYNKLIERNRK